MPPTDDPPRSSKPNPGPPAEAGASENDTEDELDEGKTAPFGWFSLIVIALLVVGLYFLVTKLREQTNLQDCVQSGRRNCAPIDDH
jgi:hypothetical protein